MNATPKKRTAKFWLCIALVICLISCIGASVVQTNFGKVTIKDLRFETSSGHQMSALLLIPDNATAENPAPAIVCSHGWYNNREMQDLNYVEYARRGFVVILPMAFALSALFGLTGVWCAFPVTEALVALVGWLLLRRPARPALHRTLP